jgi:nitroreductase
VVVTDPVRKAALAALYQPEWERYTAMFKARAEGASEDQRAAMMRTLAAGDYLAGHLQDAPVVLVFCFNPKFMAITDIDLDRVSVIGGGSVYPAVENLMLACVAEGLGCTLTTLHCYREAEVKDILGIPEGWGTAAMVPIGYPVGRGHGPISRRPPTELAYQDQFGTPWSPGAVP